MPISIFYSVSYLCEDRDISLLKSILFRTFSQNQFLVPHFKPKILFCIKCNSEDINQKNLAMQADMLHDPKCNLQMNKANY